jgi:molecular chaperone GrpE
MTHASSLHNAAKKINGQASKEHEYLLGWQRAQADLANFRKRMHEEQAHMGTRAKATMLEALLPIADNFRAIAAHAPEELQGNPWAQGVLHVARQVEQLLTELGVEIISQTGVPFDPHIHEAVAGEGDTVNDVVQAGYRLGEKVLKAAKVTVRN